MCSLGLVTNAKHNQVQAKEYFDAAKKYLIQIAEQKEVTQQHHNQLQTVITSINGIITSLDDNLEKNYIAENERITGILGHVKEHAGIFAKVYRIKRLTSHLQPLITKDNKSVSAEDSSEISKTVETLVETSDSQTKENETTKAASENQSETNNGKSPSKISTELMSC